LARVGAGMFRGEKTSLFWAGLVILSLACVFLFEILWSGYQSVPLVPSYVFLDRLPHIVGPIIFIVIGLLMMNSNVLEKTPVFWAGLLILSFAFWVAFASIWDAIRFVNWWDAIVHYSLPFIIGAVIFSLIGFCMMISGVKKDKPLPDTS